MSIFLGIGLGPIQTGIFLSGACRAAFDRLVVADVDRELVRAIRSSGRITINIADADTIRQEVIDRVEIYDPTVPEDLHCLIEIAANAGEIATALPSVKFFDDVASWLRIGFALQPEARRFIYTAENDNFAAEKLQRKIGGVLPRTYFLNTVIGKMSKVCNVGDYPELCLAPLCPGIARAHLVETFDRIYISNVPEIEHRRLHTLHVKPDLLPFEEAKLYGHNAIHFLLGWKGSQLGLTEMHELASQPELLAYARAAFLEECGKALCSKWHGYDPLFSSDGFSGYVDDLLPRIINPFLCDRIDRIIRDLPRKLDYQDRIVGTIRLCLEQQVIPVKFMELAVDCFQYKTSPHASLKK